MVSNDSAYSRYIYGGNVRQDIFVANASYVTSTTLTGSNFEGDWIDIKDYQAGSINLSWSGVDAVNGKAVIQTSPDQSIINIMGGNDGARTIDVSTGTQIWEITSFQNRYIRLKIFEGNITGGVITAASELRSFGF